MKQNNKTGMLKANILPRRVMNNILFFKNADPMSALFGGPSTPTLLGEPLPRKAKKTDKRKRKRTKQARRVNRK